MNALAETVARDRDDGFNPVAIYANAGTASTVLEVVNAASLGIVRFRVNPEDAGLPDAALEELNRKDVRETLQAVERFGRGG